MQFYEMFGVNVLQRIIKKKKIRFIMMNKYLSQIMKSFAELGLKKKVVEVLSKTKYKEPLEVQEKFIPIALKGKNLILTSKTGSGKTIAYLLGFLGKINKKNDTQMLVIVPTRELCVQVGKEIRIIAEPLGLKVGMLYGGREIAGDYRTHEKKNHIIIGAPGRVIHHINDKNISVGEVKYLVYDEADNLFHPEFYEECAYIKKRVSKVAQVILSSATITETVTKFAENELEDYEEVRVGALIPQNIVQEKIYCKNHEKNELLVNFFSSRKFKRAIIFINSKEEGYHLTEYLSRYCNAKKLTSHLNQKERKNVLELFKDGKVKILVATDIAARGLHIEKVDIIVNYNVPILDEFYIHRIGRTGRLDKKGYALTLITPPEEYKFELIEFEYELKVQEINHDFKIIERRL